MSSPRAGGVPHVRWEYRLVTCTPLSGLDEGGVRLRCQVIAPGGVRELDLPVERSPLSGIARLLNDLGREGWELVAYDTSTNRGVLKRQVLAGDET
jgi:hypothetical protein